MSPDILVTGASGGIGKALLKALRARGEGRIIAVCRDRTGRAARDADLALAVDFETSRGWSQLARAIQSHQIGYFFQLHGDAVPGDTLAPHFPARMQRLMTVNLESVVRVLDLLLPGMAKRRFGRIVLCSTASAAHGGGADSFAYGLSKAGIEYAVRHLARHYSGSGIIANAVAPGFIDTGFHGKRLRRKAADLRRRAQRIPVGRAGRAEDVAAAMLNLAFENSFVAGQVLAVDGGDFV